MKSVSWAGVQHGGSCDCGKEVALVFNLIGSP